MNKKPKVGLFVQCNASNLYPSKDQNNYVIGIAKKTKIFDEIIITTPNEEENNVFLKLSHKWQVKLYKGSIYNVCDRFIQAARLHKIDIIVRVLLKRFYLDTKTVEKMIKLLSNTNADLITLPKDYNYELAADVFTTKALEKAYQVLKKDDLKLAPYQFSPWQYMDDNQDIFKVIEFQAEKTRKYSRKRIHSIKKKLSKLYGENQEKYGWDFPASHYAFAIPFIGKNKKILDVACGQGEGSRQLAETGNKVLGVDLSSEYIENAKKHFPNPNILFKVADALTFKSPRQFDAITSMHTLEHLPDPLKFLKLCHSNLKADGKLFLEVPILLPKPLGEPLYPFHDKEFSVKELEELLKKAKFKVDRRFGRSRGVYTEINKGREAVQYHCSPI